MAYRFYRPTFKPCPQCIPCPDHEARVPVVVTERRYYVSENDGTERELTKEEYDAWDE